jgi:hypothetical protein
VSQSVSDKAFCERAIAYLKADLTGEGGEAVSLVGDDEPILRSLGNGLLVAYLVDEGDYFSYVQRRHLDLAGLSESALHNKAVANLATLLEQREARLHDLAEGASAIIFDGNFEASLILVDFLWDEELAHLAPNGFVVAIPARNTLAFCDAQSQAGLVELRHVIARVRDGDHPLQPALYRRDAATCSWRVFGA